MTNEDYIGKKLSECPDGTVAVCIAQGADTSVVRMLNDGEPWWVGGDFALLSDDGGNPSTYIVQAVVKLGEPRPKTFADCGPGEAWREPDTGALHWADDDGEMVYLTRDGIPSPNYPSSTTAWKIGPDWTRLGKITGLLIDGKPWPAKDGDE